MLKKLLIFPFGGNARESLISIFALNRIEKEWDIVGFIDDDRSLLGKKCCEIEVLGGKELLEKYSQAYVLAVPGSPKSHLKRKDIIESLGIKEPRFPRIIHPSAVISCDAKIGVNVLIMPNVIISSNVEIGDHCVILPNTVISHDSKIGNYCCIGSNVSISGNVSIETSCYIGSGTAIREDLKVAERTLVGLGSNVVSDIQAGVVVVGNPAKVIRKNIS